MHHISNVFLCFCFGCSDNEVHGRSSSQGPIRAVCGLHLPEGKAQPLIHVTSCTVGIMHIDPQLCLFIHLFMFTFAFNFTKYIIVFVVNG